MSVRYLFGPVTPAFAGQNLARQRQESSCLAFSADATTDLAIHPTDSWETVRGRFPAGWQPDFIVLYLPYTHVPACLWTAPLPLVGLAADWNLLWHSYRHQLRRCDLVLTDTPGVAVLHRDGLTHARAANLFGLERAWLETPGTASPSVADSLRESGAALAERTHHPEPGAVLAERAHHAEPAAVLAERAHHNGNQPRDIDILFAGNLNPAVQRERLAWLGRLALLGDRWRVHIATGVFGEDYRKLAGRARIVFNRSIRGECNRRVFEAVAAGALLFQEAGNTEVPPLFRDRHECVYYTADNLEALLNHYLTHEDERRAIADAARSRIQEFSFEQLWQEQVARLEAELPALVGKKVSGTFSCTQEKVPDTNGTVEKGRNQEK